jgi:tetratricopeptide (TPR) repeat protein
MPRKGAAGNSWRKQAVFWSAAAMLPVVVIVAVELLLRIVGVAAEGRTPFVPVEGREEYVALSPEFGKRYFTGFTPSVASNPFLPEKPDSTFRVFVLGGSSAAGFPYSFYYGFPGRLRERLESYIPDLRVEVINLGMTAVNSYTLWHLKDYLLQYEPDAIAIYAGHNEYYGAFGAGSTMYSLGNRIWLKRLTLRLKGSALYSLLEGLIVQAPTGADAAAAQGRTMMAQVVGDRSITLGDDIYAAGIRQFEANLSEVVETFVDADIPVYLATVASNLRSQLPLGENRKAHEEFARAEGLLNVDGPAATQSYIRAKDLDDIRFRAPEEINDVIRTAADAAGVTLVDVQSRFRAAAPGGVEGEEQFVDHLHPTFEGYDRIAEQFYEAMQSHPLLQRSRRQNLHRPPIDIDPIDRATAAIQVIRLKSGFPFRNDLTPEQELRFYSRLLDRYARSGSYTDSLAVLALNRVRPIYDVLYEGIQIARSRSDTLNALLMYRALLEWQPFNDGVNREAASYALMSPKWDDLSALLSSAVFNRNGELDYLDALAAIRLRQGELDDARRLLEVVERRNPTSRTMLYNMARLHTQLGDTTSAREYYSRLQAEVQQSSDGRR